MSVEKLLLQNMEFAKKVFKEHGKMPPLFILYTADSIIPTFIQFEDEREKAAALNLVRLLAARHKVHGYCVIHEAWVLKGMNQEQVDNFQGQVKDHEEKGEALVVGYVSHDVRKLMLTDITRKGDDVELTPGPVTNGFEGRFGQLLPPRILLERDPSDAELQWLDAMIEVYSQACGFKFEKDIIDPSELPHDKT